MKAEGRKQTPPGLPVSTTAHPNHARKPDEYSALASPARCHATPPRSQTRPKSAGWLRVSRGAYSSELAVASQMRVKNRARLLRSWQLKRASPWSVQG